MKILFLDIDGVLNSMASCITIGLSHPVDEPTQVILNPVSVGLLKEICKECDLHIYIHSTWAMRKTIWFRRLFKHYGFDAKILDRVHDSDHRVARIRQAMERYKPEQFVVLDDDDVCSKFGERFILTDSRNGLGWEHYEKALSLFGKQVPVILM